MMVEWKTLKSLALRLVSLEVVLSIFSGSVLPIQASMNGALSEPLKSFLGASSVSFAAGTIALSSVYFVDFGKCRKHPGTKKQKPDEEQKRPKLYMWILPGVVGAFYVSASSVLGPILGYGLFFVCIVTGQLCGAAIIDHFGLWNIPKSPFVLKRFFIFVLVLIGAVLAVVERLQVSSSIGMTILYILISISAGASIAMQPTLNAEVTKRIKSRPQRVALVNFALGLLILLVIWGVVLWADPSIRDPEPQDSEWWMWVGGALGATYVTASTILAPRIGVAIFFICVTAGQLASSLIIDSLGAFESDLIKLTVMRLSGVILVFVGVVAFRLEKILSEETEKSIETSDTKKSESSDTKKSESGPNNSEINQQEGASPEVNVDNDSAKIERIL